MKPNPCPPDYPYDKETWRMNLSRHALLAKIHALCGEIEKLPASEQQTKTVTMASSLSEDVAALLDMIEDKEWKKGYPDFDDGRVVLVRLHSKTNDSCLEGREYYGDPISVSCWGYKLKMTYGDFERIELDQVKEWMEI